MSQIHIIQIFTENILTFTQSKTESKCICVEATYMYIQGILLSTYWIQSIAKANKRILCLNTDGHSWTCMASFWKAILRAFKKLSFPEKSPATTPSKEGLCDTACALLKMGPFHLLIDLTNVAGSLSICSHAFLLGHAPSVSKVQDSYLAWLLAKYGAQKCHSISL